MINMTLREKIGQMFMVGVKDNQHMKRMIEDHHVGGIIHFSRNGDTSKEAYEFNALAKDLADIPLFLTIDQEGGIVTRIKSGVTPLSGNMAVSATDDLMNSYKLSSINAKELGLLGFNMNLAPVVDINVNPKNPVIHTRSYGETADRVTAFASEAFRAYEDESMISVIKHFPGHGDTDSDSHFDLPIVSHDFDRLKNVELKPFKALIDKDIPSIMISHVMFHTLDDKSPSTLSRKVITELLREEMNFKGLILSDCMEMKAINLDYGEAAVRCVEAGITMLLYSESESAQTEAIEGIYKAVLDGRLSESVIDKAVELIIRYKKKYNLSSKIKPWSYVESVLRNEDDLKLSETIARSSMTTVGSLETYKKSQSVLRLFPRSQVIGRYVKGEELYDELDAEEILLRSKNYDCVVLAFRKKTDEIVKVASALRDKVLLIPLISPYEMVSGFNGLLTYEISDLSIKSLLAVLEDKKTDGHCPVTLEE